MNGHSNFVPCFRVIQYVLGLPEMGQNVVSIQNFDPAFTPAHSSSIGNRKVAFFLNMQNFKPLRSSTQINDCGKSIIVRVRIVKIKI